MLIHLKESKRMTFHTFIFCYFFILFSFTFVFLDLSPLVSVLLSGALVITFRPSYILFIDREIKNLRHQLKGGVYVINWRAESTSPIEGRSLRHQLKGGVVQWVLERLTSNRWVVSSNSMNCSRCFLAQGTIMKSIPSLLSIGWFQERTQAWSTWSKVLVSQSN